MNSTFANHLITTIPDDSIEPGHQSIVVSPADAEGRAILCALSGVLPNNQVQITDVGGRTWVIAAHDATTDAHLVQLVDLCADLRMRAPAMLQLPLELLHAA